MPLSVAAPQGENPYIVEFLTLEHNRVDLRTGDVEETAINDLHEESLRVLASGPASTHGIEVDAGGVTVESRDGQVSATADDDTRRARDKGKAGSGNAGSGKSGSRSTGGGYQGGGMGHRGGPPRGRGRGGRGRRDEDEYYGAPTTVRVRLG